MGHYWMEVMTKESLTLLKKKKKNGYYLHSSNQLKKQNKEMRMTKTKITPMVQISPPKGWKTNSVSLNMYHLRVKVGGRASMP